MTANQPPSLRARLRNDTRGAHDSLDHLVSQFDLATPLGLSCFLQMQSIALRSIAPHAAGAVTFGAVQDLLERAAADLSALGRPDQQTRMIAGPLHPFAIDYVIAGSRLGTQVLRKRWQSASDAHVRQADAYFSAPSYIELWKSFCTSAQETYPSGPVADKVVHDADRLFGLYLECARISKATNGAIHA